MTPDTLPWLFWSYTAIWVIVVLYVLSLGLRLSKIEKDLERSEERSENDRPTAG